MTDQPFSNAERRLANLAVSHVSLGEGVNGNRVIVRPGVECG